MALVNTVEIGDNAWEGKRCTMGFTEVHKKEGKGKKGEDMELDR